MASFYIDPAERARIVTKWVKISLWFLHAWATAAVVGGLFYGLDPVLVIALFRTCTFGIGATLVILLLDRAGDVLLSKFSSTPMSITSTETVTKTVAPAPVNDVSIQAEGNVTVNK